MEKFRRVANRIVGEPRKAELGNVSARLYTYDLFGGRA